MDKVFAGIRLRRLREERGLSQVELARILAISSSYLNQIEHDARPMTVTVLVRLTEVFGIDPAFFAPRDTARQLAELREAAARGRAGSAPPHLGPAAAGDVDAGGGRCRDRAVPQVPGRDGPTGGADGLALRGPVVDAP
ncbi:helix-turn-helix transcriptional regulator [Mycolicibacterium vaccae]|nr:helix-turn-helix transcriptional regulator [Mycolicibacterium vaccae]